MQRTSGKSEEINNNIKRREAVCWLHLGAIFMMVSSMLCQTSGTQAQSLVRDWLRHTRRIFPPLTCRFLSQILLQIFLISVSERRELEARLCHRWQIISLHCTLLAICCLLTLYLRQFSLLMAEMCYALNSSLSLTYQSDQPSAFMHNTESL